MTQTITLNNGVSMPSLGLGAITAIDTGRRGALDPDDANPDVIDLTIDAA